MTRLHEFLNDYILTDIDRLTAVEFLLLSEDERAAITNMRPAAKLFAERISDQSPSMLRFLKKVLELKLVAYSDCGYEVRYKALTRMNKLLGIKEPDPALN